MGGGTPTGIENSSGQIIDPATKDMQQAIAGLFPFPYKEFEVTAVDGTFGFPATIVYRSTAAGTTVFTHTRTYDTNGNIKKVTITIP